jgi:hypothetical protein
LDFQPALSGRQTTRRQTEERAGRQEWTWTCGREERQREECIGGLSCNGSSQRGSSDSKHNEQRLATREGEVDD